MSNSRYIKSQERVKRHGEVFTPSWLVRKMLALPRVREALDSLTATFLEPAAGEGAFLREILRCKMDTAQRESNTSDDYHENVLVALSSIYGIELLQDNVEILLMNLTRDFAEHYQCGTAVFAVSPDDRVLRSADVIIRANVVQGNALTHLDTKGCPIIFSEWKISYDTSGRCEVTRTQHTLEEIIAERRKMSPEIDLFDSDSDTAVSEYRIHPRSYTKIPILDVYRQEPFVLLKSQTA